MATFPVGSIIVLCDLVAAAHLNGKTGVVKSGPDATSGRQVVYVSEMKKNILVMPANWVDSR